MSNIPQILIKMVTFSLCQHFLLSPPPPPRFSFSCLSKMLRRSSYSAQKYESRNRKPNNPANQQNRVPIRHSIHPLDSLRSLLVHRSNGHWPIHNVYHLLQANRIAVFFSFLEAIFLSKWLTHRQMTFNNVRYLLWTVSYLTFLVSPENIRGVFFWFSPANIKIVWSNGGPAHHNLTYDRNGPRRHRREKRNQFRKSFMSQIVFIPFVIVP